MSRHELLLIRYSLSPLRNSRLVRTMSRRLGPGKPLVLVRWSETSAIPVVYLTAKALPGEVERLKALGALGVLTKPFEPMTLAQQVRDTLAGAPLGA